MKRETEIRVGDKVALPHEGTVAMNDGTWVLVYTPWGGAVYVRSETVTKVEPPKPIIDAVILDIDGERVEFVRKPF